MVTSGLRRARWWRFPLYLACGLLVLLGLLWVVLQTSLAREQVRKRANEALASALQGKIVIERIGNVTPWGVRGVDARIFDAEGQQVIRAQGVSAVAWLPGLVWQLLAHSERPELALLEAHVDHVDVTLREDDELGVTLASTFSPRPHPGPAVAVASDAGLRLSIAHIAIERVWAHGVVSGSPPLDADLLGISGSLRQSPLDGVELTLHEAQLVTRALPLGLDPRGRLGFSLTAPAQERGPLRLEGSLDGSAGGSPLSLELSWVGDRLHAALTLLRLPASFVNAQAPGLALDGDVSVSADAEGELPELDFQLEADATAAHVEATGYAAIAQGQELAAQLSVTRTDLARLVAGAPASRLSFGAQALLFEQDDGCFVGAARATLAPGALAAQATPALWLTSAAELDTQRGAFGHGRFGAAEAGAAVQGGYEVRLPRGRPGLLALSSHATLADPPRLARLGVSATGEASLRAELVPDSGALAAHASLSLTHLERAQLQARHVELQATVSGTLASPRLHADTALDLLSGRARADLDYSQAQQRLELSLANIDLLRLGRQLGTRLPLEQATLNLDAQLSRRAPDQRYTLNANATTSLGTVGEVSLVAKELKLPATPARVGSWTTAEGVLSAQGKLDLSAASPLFERAGLPLERSSGRVRFEANARRRVDDAQGFELSAQLDTDGLRIVQERAATDEIVTTSDAIAGQPHALEGVDIHATAHAWPERGDLVATAILRDAGGTLLEVQAETPELPQLLAHPTADAVARLPLQIQLELPERRLQSLPGVIRPSALRGRVALQGKLDGSLQSPHVEASITARSLRSAGSKDPVDVIADVRYTPAEGELHGLARLSKKLSAEVGSLALRWQGDLRGVGSVSDAARGLVASADAKLQNFPLDVVPALVDRQLAGSVNGELELEDWGKDARVDVRIDSRSLVLGQVPVRELSATAHTDAERISADATLLAGEGSSRARLVAAMRWGSRPLPELGHDGTAELEAHAFQLETLSPLLGAYVSELAGVLDAQTRLVVTPGSTQLSGNARLEKGVVQVPTIGQRFSDISAAISVADDQVKLERFEARGTTGRVSVRGAAHLDGFALRRAEGELAIQKHESLPITLEGVALGDAWGNVNARYDGPEQGERKLDIQVPSLHLLTPETSGHGLQSLDESESIRVGVQRADGKFVELPVQPLAPSTESSAGSQPAQPLRVVIELGNDVTVERGTSAQAQLTGRLTILSAEQTEVDGRIEVRGGKLDVSGKTFEIERGVVTFHGDHPSNPSIAATARWDAPGYSVYADYVGDVENGRIKLHAEPPLTQDEIASLLLFGSPEGSVGGSGDSSAAALAVSVAGDSAVRGLNHALDSFTKLDVSARVDTTTGNARPELVFQVSPRVAAKVTRAIGAPAAGESPDRTFLTLELRLKRAWALSAVLGDHGASALDLIWRRRY